MVAAVAARQRGVVTVGQLRQAGIGRNGAAHRVRHGRLVPIHRGVYRVGPVAAPLSREVAALLACGPTAALSHHTAAAVWGLRPPHPGDVHVTVTGQRATNRPGLRVHRTHSLDAAVHDGLRLTAPARTLLDLAPLLPRPALERAAEQAVVLRLTTHDELARECRPGRRGTARLRAALPTEPSLTRSEAERRLLALVRAARLPRPRTNVRVAGHEVDLLWREQKLVVEVDGFAYHGSRQAFERDRRRDADLTAAGFRVVRFTWRQIAHEPEAVLARLAVLLAGRAAAA